jgi:hypothetical protein
VAGALAVNDRIEHTSSYASVFRAPESVTGKLS